MIEGKGEKSWGRRNLKNTVEHKRIDITEGWEEHDEIFSVQTGGSDGARIAKFAKKRTKKGKKAAPSPKGVTIKKREKP